MKELLDYARWYAYAAVGGILLSVLTFGLLPYALPPVWVATLFVICVGGAVAVIGLAVVGISRLARRLTSG